MKTELKPIECGLDTLGLVDSPNLDLQSIKCLVCLSTSVDEKVYHSLTSSFPGFLSTPTTVIGVLQIVLNRKIKVAKDWPDRICTSCLKELKDTYKFIQQLINSLAHLKRKTKELKDINRDSIESEIHEPQVILKVEESPIEKNIKSDNDQSKQDILKEEDTKTETKTTEKVPLHIESNNDQSKTAPSSQNFYNLSNFTLEIDPSNSDLLIPLYSEPVDLTEDVAPKTKIYPTRKDKSRKRKAEATTSKRGVKKTNAKMPVKVTKEQGPKNSNGYVPVEDTDDLQEPNIALEHNYTRSPDCPLEDFELDSDEELSVLDTPEKCQQDTSISEIEQILAGPELSTEIPTENESFAEIEEADMETDKLSPPRRSKRTQQVLKPAESPKKSGGIIMMSVEDVLNARSRKKNKGTTLAVSPRFSRRVKNLDKKEENQTKNVKESAAKNIENHTKNVKESAAKNIVKQTKNGKETAAKNVEKQTKNVKETAAKNIDKQTKNVKESAAKNDKSQTKNVNESAAKIDEKQTKNVKKSASRKDKNQTKNVEESDASPVASHKCDWCPKTFETTKGVTVHKIAAHNKEYLATRLVCQDCGQGFVTKPAWHYHRIKFHPKMLHRCEECNREFYTAQILRDHQKRAHVGLKATLMCNQCGKLFKYPNALKYHLVSVHNESERKHLCRFCGYKSITRSQLKNHEMIHTGERPYKCKLCPNSYKRSNELLYHKMKIHERKSLHHCKFCGKGFIKKWNMTLHWMQHKGDYKCTICPKAFKDEEILNIHHKYHHKDVVIEKSENVESSDIDDAITGGGIIKKDEEDLWEEHSNMIDDDESLSRSLFEY